jgi:perosamine synthetase
VKIQEQTIPFHFASVGEEEAQAAADVVRSGWLTMGPKTIEFEQKFASYIGVKHAIGVNSCTAAIATRGRSSGADNHVHSYC